jgi:hypothetical protein
MSVGPITAALIGAGGAIVGGGITSASNVALERGRAKRANDDAATARTREIRRVARLVISELDLVRAHLAAALEAETWQDPKAHFSVKCWNELKSALAAELPEDAWEAVMDAYIMIGILIDNEFPDAPTANDSKELLKTLDEATLTLQGFVSGKRGVTPENYRTGLEESRRRALATLDEALKEADESENRP